MLHIDTTAEREGFEPPVRQAHSGFQDRHIRPLCHLSRPRPRGATGIDPTIPASSTVTGPTGGHSQGTRRRQDLLKNPRRCGLLARAGSGESGSSSRPSARACPIAGHTGRRAMSVACRAW